MESIARGLRDQNGAAQRNQTTVRCKMRHNIGTWKNNARVHVICYRWYASQPRLRAYTGDQKKPRLIFNSYAFVYTYVGGNKNKTKITEGVSRKVLILSRITKTSIYVLRNRNRRNGIKTYNNLNLHRTT